MKKLKVMTVVGTRPEIIRLSRVLARLDEHCEHMLVHTGQNYDYELNQVFFEDLGVRKPDHFLDCATGRTIAAQTIGSLIIAVDQVLADEQPPRAATRAFVVRPHPSDSRRGHALDSACGGITSLVDHADITDHSDIAASSAAKACRAGGDAGSGGHQQLPRGDPGQAAQDSDLSHGGRQSVLRSASA